MAHWDFLLVNRTMREKVGNNDACFLWALIERIEDKSILTNDFIKKELLMSKNTIIKARKILLENGLITVIPSKGGVGKPNIMNVIYPDYASKEEIQRAYGASK